MNETQTQIVTLQIVADEVQSHPVCKQLFLFVKNGWPCKEKIPESLSKFYKFRDSLDLEENCIFYGNRLFIPPSVREKVFSLIHREHIGIVKCKQIARSSVWWPKIDSDIEFYVNSCHVCQVNAPKKSSVPLMSWKATSYPFERVHADHFFFEGKTFLVIVDDYSNWIEVYVNKHTDTDCVILSLKSFCATFGMPNILVTDNATAFSSVKFETFCHVNGIKHLFSPPYHPQSNGLAERTVAIVKSNFKKFRSETKSKQQLEEHLPNFLYKSHTTPLSDCGKSPADLIFNFPIRDHFVYLQRPEKNASHKPKPLPDFGSAGTSSNTQSKESALNSNQFSKSMQPKTTCKLTNPLTPKHSSRRKIINHKLRENRASQSSEETPARKLVSFNEGDKVYYCTGQEWVKAVILKKVSPLTYRIQLSLSKIIKSAHLDSLKPFIETSVPLNETIETPVIQNEPSGSQQLPSRSQSQEDYNRRQRRSGLKHLPRSTYSHYF